MKKFVWLFVCSFKFIGLFAYFLMFPFNFVVLSQEQPEGIQHFKEVLKFGPKSVDSYWQNIFSRINKIYKSPTIVSYYDKPIQTPCGTISLNNAAYCPASNTIYVDLDFLYQKYLTYGDYAVVTIFAHEWGHAAQFQLGEKNISLWAENQADCFCGAYTKAVYSGNYGIRLDEGDVEEAEQVLFSLGSVPQNWGGAEAHGSKNQRLGNFRKGFIYGLTGCFER